MRFYYIFLVIFMAGSLCAYSQNTISGSVTTTQNKPLDGAHIHIEELHAMSNPDGSYKMQNIPAGQHRVVVSYIGYKSLDTLIYITDSTRLDAILKPEATQLQEVVLSANNAVPKNVIHEQKLKTETIEKYSNASL